MSIFVVNARLDIQKLLKHLVISLGTGILASIFSGNAAQIYANYNKPSFAPPGFIFPIVWTVLYIAIAIAAYMVDISCEKGFYSSDRKAVLNLYYMHLLFNFMWPVIFFNFGYPIFALVDIILMIVFIVLIIIGFAKFSKNTLIFTLPYFLWCIYAMILNIAFV